MNTIVIKQTNHHGATLKAFCAYRSGRTDLSLGVTASSAADPATVGAYHCAAKAFIKLVEPKADRDEIETRIALKEISPGIRIWEATLQPKSPCDTLSDTRPVKSWYHVQVAMPDADLTVLVHIPGAVWLGYWDGVCWRDVSGLVMPHEVIHWMDLPDPPEVVA